MKQVQAKDIKAATLRKRNPELPYLLVLFVSTFIFVLAKGDLTGDTLIFHIGSYLVINVIMKVIMADCEISFIYKGY